MYSLQDNDSRRWVSPFGHLRINACLAASRSFSQPTTSFIAAWRLGIHRVPLIVLLASSLGFRSRSQAFFSIRSFVKNVFDASLDASHLPFHNN
jgi:hypothetical protein